MAVSRRIRLLTTAAACVVLGITGVACNDDSADTSSGEGTASAAATEAGSASKKPSEPNSTASSSQASKPESTPSSPEAPTSGSTPPGAMDLGGAIDDAEQNGTTIDIALTHNSTCSSSGGETLKLDKIKGGWTPGMYVVLQRKTPEDTEVPGGYIMTSRVGDPMETWDFPCAGKGIGSYDIRFVGVGTSEGEDPQVTEEVTITVTA